MYKKILLLNLLLFCCCLYSKAQLKKGSLWGGGSFGYSSHINRINGVQEPQARRKVSSFALFAGVSTRENSVSGITLQYRKEREKYITTGGRSTIEIDYGAGYFYRMYKSLGKGFYIYLNGEVIYLYGTNESRSVDNLSDFNTSKDHEVRLSFYPGIAYALNNNLHLEMRTGNLLNALYADRKKHSEWPVNNKLDEHSRSFEITGSFNETFNYLGIGFRILLNGKEQVKNPVDPVR